MYRISLGKNKSTIFQVRRIVNEGLCKLGLNEKAIELAEQHKDIPAIVASVNTSYLSAQTVQQKNIHFIDLFKEEYFNALLEYLDSISNFGEEESKKQILNLCALYPVYARKHFDQNELKVSWIYHLKAKNYEKTVRSLQECLKDKDLDEEKRTEYLGWVEMVNAAISCRKDKS